ncbi:MAG: arylesterase [Campylobacterales bacterium]|nr:arylesterase [Campylobacterales bacterium]
MKYLISAVLILLVFFSIYKRPDVHPIHLTPQDTILAFGDSLTFGYGAAADQSYPAVLEKLSGNQVINAGINGETSTGALKRLPGLLKDPSIKLMILCVGGNDILRGHSLQTLKTNIKSMIHLAKSHNIEVVLVAVPDISLFGLDPLELYEEVADEEEVPLIEDMLSHILSQPTLKSDQIHPNASGYKQMAQKIHETIRSLQ